MELEITIDNIQDIKKKRLLNGYIALFYSHNCGHCVSFIPTWKSLKKKLSKEYQFIELEHQNMQKLTKDFNISFNKVKYFPYICIYSPDKKEHIEYNERRRDEESLTKFIKTNLSKSQPCELTNDNIIDQIKQIELDNKKGYILLVYWKTCPYCIRFMELWNELKEKYNDKVQFFQLEKEELDKIKEKKYKKLSFLNDIRSFPTILIYNNDIKDDIIKFEEDRNNKNLSNFIETNLL